VSVDALIVGKLHAKLHGLDPEGYVRYDLQRIAEHSISELKIYHRGTWLRRFRGLGIGERWPPS
jgi:hypothetical protein